MNSSLRAKLVMDAISRAIDCDFQVASNLMGEIFRNSTGQQIYGVCCGLADAARQTLVRLYGHQGPETMWALAAPDPDYEPQHPAHAFSLRFITAFANGDMETCQALYLAASKASADDYAHSVIALLGDVARLARRALLQLAEGGEEPVADPH
ncbi:hypothetical protein OH809_24920 [Streptomyces sp. NBC_00873]|uniref:hypothetical protein n=1 Tax=Streptomyces sp. NBC_00873 TaxID=2975852 RepID=UPI003865C155|nr:hypothetical protein OH809_24920 [Streptomyces sp. NBC_00873]